MAKSCLYLTMCSLWTKSLRSALFPDMSSWQQTEFATFPAALNNHYPQQAGPPPSHPNRPVRGQVRRLRWLTPGKLLPDRNGEKGGRGMWSRRANTEREGGRGGGGGGEGVGWGRGVLLRCRVEVEGEEGCDDTWRVCHWQVVLLLNPRV